MAAPVFKAPVRPSSNIAALAYDEGKGWVEFHGGRRFAYVMPESLFTEMAEADSVGKFFAAHVKGKFEVAATSQRCSFDGCQTIIEAQTKPGRCATHRKHNFPDEGGFQKCTGCGLYLEECMEVRFCRPKSAT